VDPYTAILIGIGIIILLMIANLFVMQGKKQPPTATEIGQALTFPTTPEIAGALNIPTTEQMKTALSASLEEKEISAKIGAFSTSAANMEEATRKFNQMVATKSKRAGWGEWHLDQELKEAFPSVKLRQEVKELGSLKPDAHMRTPDGKVLIVDSKFVYDTYNTYIETPETQVKKRENLLTTFRGDIKKHVLKIKDDYVQPGKGTHEFAFMYIPSTGVYEFLIDKESEIVRWAATQGVVICSPMTLMANMHMLEIARMAQNMSNMHNEILDAHLRVQKNYEDFEDKWKILTKHLTNALKQQKETQGAINLMDTEISALSALDKSIGQGSEEE
jgi:DNA anti-recombination protein RmuC